MIATQDSAPAAHRHEVEHDHRRDGGDEDEGCGRAERGAEHHVGDQGQPDEGKQYRLRHLGETYTRIEVCIGGVGKQL